MDKTWTWGELYAEIEKIVGIHCLDPRWDCVVNLFMGYSANWCKIQDFIDGPLSKHGESEEVRLLNEEYWYSDEFSIALHPNGNILLGTEEMIKEFIDKTSDDYEY